MDGDQCLSHQPASAELQKAVGLLYVAARAKSGGKSVLGRTRPMFSRFRGVRWVGTGRLVSSTHLRLPGDVCIDQRRDQSGMA